MASWAQGLLDKAPAGLVDQYNAFKDEAVSAATDAVHKLEADFAYGDAKSEPATANKPDKSSSSGAAPSAALGPLPLSAPSDTPADDAHNGGAGVTDYLQTLWTNVQDPNAFQRLKEEVTDEFNEGAGNLGFLQQDAQQGDEQGAAPADANTQSESGFLPSFIAGPIDRIRKYMSGELPFKGLGICNCFIGPKGKDDRGKTNPKRKATYGLGVCICCVGGQPTPEEESDMRKDIQSRLRDKYQGSAASARLVTADAETALSRYRREGKTTQSTARARAEARVQRFLALQERAEERTARLQGKFAKYNIREESAIETQAKDILAKAQHKRLQDLENAKVAHETPFSLNIGRTK